MSGAAGPLGSDQRLGETSQGLEWSAGFRPQESCRAKSAHRESRRQPVVLGQLPGALAGSTARHEGSVTAAWRMAGVGEIMVVGEVRVGMAMLPVVTVGGCRR